jgi:prefoldin subunit 5
MQPTPTNVLNDVISHLDTEIDNLSELISQCHNDHKAKFASMILSYSNTKYYCKQYLAELEAIEFEEKNKEYLTKLIKALNPSI